MVSAWARMRNTSCDTLREFRQHIAEIERTAIGDAGLDPRLDSGSERRIDRAQALPDHGDRSAINIRTPFQHVDDGADHASPVVADRQTKGCLALPRSVERYRGKAAGKKAVTPRVQFLFAASSPGRMMATFGRATPTGRRK